MPDKKNDQESRCDIRFKTNNFKWICYSAVIIIILSIPVSTAAIMFDPDYFGVDVWGGIESNLHPDWDTHATDHSWFGLIFKWGKYLSKHRFRINISPQIGLHHAEKDKIGKEFSKYGVSLGTDVWLLRDFQIPHTKSFFYVGAGLG